MLLFGRAMRNRNVYLRRAGSARVRYGFSLIELITSLAVLAVLIGILLPGLNQAMRVSAPLVKCSNNLSQLYRAINMYLSDSEGKAPLASYQPMRDDVFTPLDVTLEPYGGGNGELWLCPLDPRRSMKLKRMGSYVYPIAKLQNSGTRIFLASLPQQFPILTDRIAFHAVDPRGPKRLTAQRNKEESSPIEQVFKYNPGPGYNRILINGKITAYPHSNSN